MAKRDMTFLNGIIKSLEKELLAPATLMRIIDEPDYKSAFRALKEQGFGRNAVADDADSEAILQAETLALDDFAREFSPGDEYSEFCLAGIDFYNAERLLRSEHIKGFGFVQTRTGLIGDVAAALETCEKNTKYGKAGQSGGKDKNALPYELVSAYAEGKALFESGKASGAEISSIFIRARYARLLKKCGGQLNAFLKNEIDCKNISTALRAKTQDEIDKLFIGGGSLKKEDIDFIFSQDADKTEKRFAFTPFADVIATAEKEKAAGLPLVRFEAEADGFALKELKKKKYETEGATPFVLYYLYKSAEIKNVRIILTGKRAGASAEDIKRRLRTGYDG
ncbi:MAG: V-type ATPase subunit [Candidatus Borkfalkiaceae bacterium]|nr:V-type ATPase subunit [Christensenellaceae bacterium]